MELKQIELTEPEAAWLAAVIDGEGTISFMMKRDKQSQKPVIEPHVSIYNTNRPFLSYAKAILDCGNIYETSHDCFEFRANSCSICSQILHQIFKYLIIKKFQARKVMQFCDRKVGPYTLKDLHIYEAVKRVNWKSGPMLENELYKELKIQLNAGGD